MKKNPLNLRVDLEDFLPATEAEKEYMVRMRPATTFFQDGMKRLLRNKVATVSMILIVVITLAAIFIPFFWPYSYDTMLGVRPGKPVDASFNNLAPFQYGKTELTYAWDFGDGETSDAVNPTHTYAEEGTYSVYLTVSDGKAESTAQQEVTVQTTHCSPKHSAMYFASTNNKWTFDQMAYNDDDCAWEIAVDFSGKGDENGDQRFKVTTAADWQHGIYGQGLDNGLC